MKRITMFHLKFRFYDGLILCILIKNDCHVGVWSKNPRNVVVSWMLRFYISPAGTKRLLAEWAVSRNKTVSQMQKNKIFLPSFCTQKWVVTQESKKFFSFTKQPKFRDLQHSDQAIFCQPSFLQFIHSFFTCLLMLFFVRKHTLCFDQY